MKSLDELKKSLIGMSRGLYVVNFLRLESKLAKLEAEIEMLEFELKTTNAFAVDICPSCGEHVCNRLERRLDGRKSR